MASLHWRRVGLLALAIVLAAGCIATPVTNEPSARTERQTPAEAPETIDRGHPTISPADRLLIDKRIRANVTVSMYDENVTSPSTTSNVAGRVEPVASVRYEPHEKGVVGVTEFAPDGYVIVAVEDRILWRGWVEPYEHLKLAVEADGEVVVVDHWVL